MKLFEQILKDTVLSPVFIGAVGLILICERLFPVNKKQKTFSAGFLQDGIWVVFALLFQNTVLVIYANAISTFYKTHLDFLTLSVVGQLPQLVRVLIGLIVGDLMAWFQHWLKHRVPWFWEIHAVHHSQKEINLFTDYRFHYAEYLISRPIVLIPLMILNVDTSKIVAINLLAAWQVRFYHANIRSNLGLLRYIFVTPQSHRVHHSIEHRHRDQNFGVVFSFWDRFFKTQYASCDEYPETGINDSRFPLEKNKNIFGLLWKPVTQLIYPFRVIAQNLTKNTANDAR